MLNKSRPTNESGVLGQFFTTSPQRLSEKDLVLLKKIFQKATAFARQRFLTDPALLVTNDPDKINEAFEMLFTATCNFFQLWTSTEFLKNRSRYPTTRHGATSALLGSMTNIVTSFLLKKAPKHFFTDSHLAGSERLSRLPTLSDVRTIEEGLRIIVRKVKRVEKTKCNPDCSALLTLFTESLKDTQAALATIEGWKSTWQSCSQWDRSTYLFLADLLGEKQARALIRVMVKRLSKLGIPIEKTYKEHWDRIRASIAAHNEPSMVVVLNKFRNAYLKDT